MTSAPRGVRALSASGIAIVAVSTAGGLAIVAALLWAVWLPHARLTEADVVPGVYEGPAGASVTINADGSGTFQNVSAKAAALGDPGVISGPVTWHLVPKVLGGSDLEFAGVRGIEPEKYAQTGFGSIYEPGRKPYILWYFGDPDEDHEYRLTLHKP